MKKYTRNQALQVVESGYDQIGERYSTERNRFDNWKEVKAFSSLLPEKAKVLDAGCGTGVPVAKFLVQSGFEVVGIDLSKEMVAAARKNVLGATFEQIDMASLDFSPECFDGLICCYAIIHNPKERHADIFRSFHTVLKAGGILLVSVACGEWEEFADYLGVDMFWSHYGAAKTKSLLTEAGFVIEFGRDVESGSERHHWVLARKR